jgi:DNA-directed RNA polymerase specialized sigma24 family protein
MTYEQALRLLPVIYAQALTLRDAGHDEQQIAAALSIERAAIGPTVRLAEAKLARLLSMDNPNTTATETTEPGPPAFT